MGSFGSPFFVNGGLYGTDCVDRNDGGGMDTVRIVKRLLFVLLLVASSAFADAPVTWYFINGYSWFPTTPYSTADELCSAFVAARNGADPTTVSVCSARTQGPTYIYTDRTPAGGGSTTYNISYNISSTSRCSDGTAPNTSLPLNEQCAAPAPQCEPYRQSSVKVSQGTAIPGTNKSSDMSPPTNINGCRVLAGEVEKCTMDPTTNEVFCTWRVTETGAAAPSGETPDSVSTTTSDTEKSDVPEFNPAQGQGCPKGTVNLGTDSTGGSICGGKGTSPDTPTQTETKQPTQTVTNPDGSTTQTDVTTRTNSDGSTTTTTKTTKTNPDGSTSTTTSSVTGNKPGGAGGGGGGAGKDDSSDDKKDDFCAKHPELNACKNSQVSGKCEELTCKGDAIMCAVARSAAEQNCREKAERDQLKEMEAYKLGAAVLAGNDPKAGDLPTKDNAEQITMESLDQSGFLGGGASCLNDVQVSVMGRAVVLPFSKVCPYIEALRYVMMTIAALVSLSILRRPILGD